MAALNPLAAAGLPVIEKRNYGLYGIDPPQQQLTVGLGKSTPQPWAQCTENLTELIVQVYGSATRLMIMDVLVNGVVKAANIPFNIVSGQVRMVRLPLAISAGQIVSISGATSASGSVFQVVLIGGKPANGVPGVSQIDAITPTSNTPASNGVVFDALNGLPANGGGWLLLSGGALAPSATLNAPLDGIMVAAHPGSKTSGRTAAIYYFDIGVGDGTSGGTTPIIQNIAIAGSTTAINDPVQNYRVPVPSGAQLYARLSGSTVAPAAAGDTIAIVAHGIVL